MTTISFVEQNAALLGPASGMLPSSASQSPPHDFQSMLKQVMSTENPVIQPIDTQSTALLMEQPVLVNPSFSLDGNEIITRFKETLEPLDKTELDLIPLDIGNTMPLGTEPPSVIPAGMSGGMGESITGTLEWHGEHAESFFGNSTLTPFEKSAGAPAAMATTAVHNEQRASASANAFTIPEGDILPPHDFQADGVQQEQAIIHDRMQNMMNEHGDASSIASATETLTDSVDTSASELRSGVSNGQTIHLFRTSADAHPLVMSPAGAFTMKQTIQMMIKDNLSEIEIQIDPPELGAMMIKLKIEQGQQAHVVFHSPHPSVRDLLLDNLDRLRESLEDIGVDLGGIDVQVGAQGQESSEQRLERFVSGLKTEASVEQNSRFAERDEETSEPLLHSASVDQALYLINERV